jgi:methionyl-tRNA synthetase
MYVWFDALVNYLTAVDYFHLEKSESQEKDLSRFWPASIQVIGQDISWFHTVIWPAMLMSAGVPLPKTVLIHGFVVSQDGRKMSKSLV